MISRKAALSVIAGFSFIGLATAGYMEKPSTEKTHETYCTGVAVWNAEGARGVAKLNRTGHPDWRDIAEEYCPGMRPATL